VWPRATSRSGVADPTISGFATTNDYILGPSGEQMTEMGMDANNTLAWLHTNVWAGGALIATYDGTTVSGKDKTGGLHFYFNDPLGSRRVQTDFAGNIEKTCSSLPFGDAETGATAPTEHLFTGKERDAESGNDYFGARYYASSMGRFLSPDWSAKEEPVPYAKLDDPRSLNLYQYVGNNPLSGFDADGHQEAIFTPEGPVVLPTGPTTLTQSQYNEMGNQVGDFVNKQVGFLKDIAREDVAAVGHALSVGASLIFSKDAEANSLKGQGKDASSDAEAAIETAKTGLAKGAYKNPADVRNHISGLQKGVDKVRSLSDKLDQTKGQKARDQVKSDLKTATRDVQSHTKDLSQKPKVQN
jgi:RHS repeat-associated protein